MAKFAYTILFVRDMARSIAFYRDLLGLNLKMESPEWSEFAPPATEGCTLALHLAAGGSLPAVQEGQIPAGHAHTGFLVDNIDTFAEKMAAHRVPVMRAVKTEDFGARMGVWRDPDGIPVSVMSFGK